ncbi:MAG: hypothetical protein WCK35_22200 [Chloroflexota bacterium]
MPAINRYSSRRNRLDHAFLSQRQKGARLYDRIAGYFNSFLFELVGGQLEGMSGKIRVICNSVLKPIDVYTAKAASVALCYEFSRSADRLRLVRARSEHCLIYRWRVD